MAFQLGPGSRHPSQAPAWTQPHCQAPRQPSSPKGQSGVVPQDNGSPSPTSPQPGSLQAPRANKCPLGSHHPPSTGDRIQVTAVGWRQCEEGRGVGLGSEHLGARGLCCPARTRGLEVPRGAALGRLTPLVSPGSEPSSGRRARALREAPVRCCFQDHRHQPPGSSADPQRLEPQPGGDPEELRPLVQGERQVGGRLLLPAVQGGESQGAAGRGAPHPGQGREGEGVESRDVTPAVPTPLTLNL